MDRAASLVQLDAVADELTRRGEADLAQKTREAVAVLRSGDAAPDLMTTGEAARLLGVRSINTVKAWVRDGLLDGMHVGGRMKVSRASIERWIDSNSRRSFASLARCSCCRASNAAVTSIFNCCSEGGGS